jgi:hypothetical protein
MFWVGRAIICIQKTNQPAPHVQWAAMRISKTDSVSRDYHCVQPHNRSSHQVHPGVTLLSKHIFSYQALARARKSSELSSSVVLTARYSLTTALLMLSFRPFVYISQSTAPKNLRKSSRKTFDIDFWLSFLSYSAKDLVFSVLSFFSLGLFVRCGFSTWVGFYSLSVVWFVRDRG